MGNEPILDEEAIFSAAIAIDEADKQLAYLRQVCGSDTALLARVEALLKAHASKISFIEQAAGSLQLTINEPVMVEGPGTVIGRYRLLEKIGEGGMAVVYMAEQEQPIRRKVALKIIKLGMDTRQVIARFEAERQALALMDHPSIAKVLDAGATETGRPYFVMELVTGVSITEYCDRNSLSTKDRLALFLQVCNAVQHAHQKGIIHRDIKPSNVMVTHHDGQPIPKVIDFGIAKATNQKLTEKTLFTRYAHIIGTPAYMSPEQAELSDLDIDTRTDIYSLGVLLYELLTGTTPFSEEELRKAGYVEMQRVIREQEPVKPSTRIRTALRGASVPARLRTSCEDARPTKKDGVRCTPYQQVRGDLDWIVMKSLEKDRARRYETTSGLAEDVRRHLEHEPVMARGPSTGYRLHKFLRRHRSQAIAALATAVFVGAAVVVLSLWNRDRLQLVEAEGFRHKNILSQAREQYAKAEREAALETIQPILDSQQVGPEARLLHAGILVDNRRSDEAVTILNGLLNDRPEIAGAAHALFARILWESESPNAETLKELEEHRQKAEALLPETAEAYFLRAMTALTVKEQLAALDRALQLDSKHYESRRLRAFTYYASRKYDRLRDDALAMTILREGDPLGYSLRAIAGRELGRYRDAIADYDIAIALTANDDPQYVDLSVQRCEVFLRMGDYERVIAEATVGARGFSPPQYHIFCALTALGEYEKATALFRQIISPGYNARSQFQNWCMKYVFDTLEAGRSWHPPGREPAGPAFLPMVEAEETYRDLSAKGQRVLTDGFTGNWSPDGTKLAFSLGFVGNSGVAVFDPVTKETDLLIVPGKDPRWSPDGRYIAFVRDCEVLRLPDLTAAAREIQSRPMANEEVWIIRPDGTEPRRLAFGGWPSWSRDSKRVYYQSRVDKMFCSIPAEGTDAQPAAILPCTNTFPAISPDGKRVAYLESASLKVKELASQKVVAQWPTPLTMWGGPAWSPTGNELCLGGAYLPNVGIGLWIYPVDGGEPAKVLSGQTVVAFWAWNKTKLLFALGPPYNEIWTADLDPKIPTVEALGPARTLQEHYQEMVAFYTRRIEADPEDAYAYSSRAQYYGYLGDRAQATADMRHWSTIMGGDGASAVPLAASRDSRRVIDLPFDCQLVFSAERPVHETPVVNVAFGQKGRFEMRLFEIPMFAASLFGVCLLSSVDAQPAQAGFTFGEPQKVSGLRYNEWINRFSSDGLEMYSEAPGISGPEDLSDLWVRKRASKDADWGPPENLGPLVNSSYPEYGAYISSDGLTLYFVSYNRPDGCGDRDIYVTTRATKNDPWGTAVNLGPPFNSSSMDRMACISPDGLELYFGSNRPGGYGASDIYVARRATPNGPWETPVHLDSTVNSPYGECYVSLSPDGLLLFFSEWYTTTNIRPGGHGAPDIWMARRASIGAPWQTAVNLESPINGPTNDIGAFVSPDGQALYFNSVDREGGGSFRASILPVVDFNGDGKVDGKEVLAMAEHWDENYPPCDIAPFAWGNGVVDANDLTVLSGYIGQDVNDPSLLAHWALDETAGMTAADSAGDNDAMVLGNAAWQPDGKIGGALAFDGKDDFVRSGKSVLDPSKEPLSVIVWIKGGAPNRVIVSQASGADWLYLNQYGMLTTDLKSSGTNGKSLTSDAYLLDDQWHRVALVWDGTNRTLQMDGAEVARDTQPNLAASSGSLLIGGGKTLTPANLWSGLIDDVRIYNRIVQP
jgi:serine/threonine protein kinase/Tol biopolymer transport system component